MIPLVAQLITGEDRGYLENFIDGYLGWPGEDDEVRTFEEEFAEYVGCRGGVAVNSGTNALIIVLKALGPAYVSLPSYSCRALLDAAHAANRKPDLCDNLCDIPAADFSADVDTGPELLVLPHMFGTDAGRYPHRDTVDDITLSLGAVHAPQIAVASFNKDKMISTGRGGMIVSQDQSFLDRCRELAYYDTALLSEPDGASGASNVGDSSGPSGSESNGYRPAFSFGMTAMQAALGRSQLAQLPAFIERRREIAARYTEAFTGAGIECPGTDTGSVFFRYIVGTENPAQKVASLAGRGIECGRGVNPPLHRLLGLPNEGFPGAEECYAKLLSVPVHPGLTEEQVGYIIEQVVGVCAP